MTSMGQLTHPRGNGYWKWIAGGLLTLVISFHIGVLGYGYNILTHISTKVGEVAERVARIEGFLGVPRMTYNERQTNAHKPRK